MQQILDGVLKGQAPSSVHSHHFQMHLDHCLSYLKQAIMCNGDTTLEKAQVINGSIIESSDGWGTLHECRNYDWIVEYATTHKYESQRHKSGALHE